MRDRLNLHGQLADGRFKASAGNRPAVDARRCSQHAHVPHVPTI